MPTLAPWAPEQVTPSLCDHLHRRVAHQTWLVLSSVDVDLATVAINTGRSPHRLRGVLWLDGINASCLDPGAHEHDQIIPHCPPCRVGNLLARGRRIDPMPEEDLGSVDVANPRCNLLVQ